MRKRINKLLSLIILVTTLFNCSVNVFANEDINHETIQSDNIVEDNFLLKFISAYIIESHII